MSSLWRQLLLSLSGLGLLFALGWYFWPSLAPTNPAKDDPNSPPPERGVVLRILDGTTLELESGHLIRYLGLRTPLATQPVQCFGPEALRAQEQIIGQTLRFEVDPLINRSRDGAWLRYVYLPDGEEEFLINEKILAGGFGFPVVSEDMKHGAAMLAAAKFASATRKGLWGKCEILEETRGEETMFATPPLTDCVLKGLLAADKQKIYRTPSCPAYGETLVLESQGGRWFCAEDTAQAEGFALAPDCS
jgi:endonuclease YncB( thermonuclease family)